MSQEHPSPAMDPNLIPNPAPDPIPVRVAFAQEANTGEWRAKEVTPSWDEATETHIQLHFDEAEGYYLNVTTEQPAIFVHWRQQAPDTPPVAMLVTLSYYEAGRLLDAGENIEALPMPPEMQAWLTEYVNLNYQPEQKKRKNGLKNRPSFMKPEEFARMVENEKRFYVPGETESGPQ